MVDSVCSASPGEAIVFLFLAGVNFLPLFPALLTILRRCSGFVFVVFIFFVVHSRASIHFGLTGSAYLVCWYVLVVDSCTQSLSSMGRRAGASPLLFVYLFTLLVYSGSLFPLAATFGSSSGGRKGRKSSPGAVPGCKDCSNQIHGIFIHVLVTFVWSGDAFIPLFV